MEKSGNPNRRLYRLIMVPSQRQHKAFVKGYKNIISFVSFAFVAEIPRWSLILCCSFVVSFGLRVVVLYVVLWCYC